MKHFAVPNKIKLLLAITVFLFISSISALAYGPNSSSQTIPGISLPQVSPNLFFDLLQNVTNYLNNVFNSGQLPNIPNLAPQPNLGGLNLGQSGGVLNQIVGIITKIIQIFINLVILFVKQMFMLVPITK